MNFFFFVKEKMFEELLMFIRFDKIVIIGSLLVIIEKIL